MSNRYALWAAIVVVAAAFMYFGGLGSYGFLDPDEGRYAEIAREMLESRDFITPHLNYVKYFEKPPLLYWLVAGAMAVFGETEGVARSVPAACGLLTLLVVILLAWRMSGPRTAAIAAWVYATSLLPLVLSRYLVIDSLLAFCLAAAWAAWWIGHSSADRSASRCWFTAAWVFLGLATMAKGPVAVVLSALLIAAYAAATRDARALLRTFVWQGLVLFAAIVLPWFVLVSLRNPEFLRYFVVVQHLQRFAGREHVRPFWFFGPILLAGMGGWCFISAAALLSPAAAALRRRRAAAVGLVATAPALPRHPAPDVPQHRDPTVYLLLWVAVVVGFFSISKCKLPTYILPAFPAMALLVARYIEPVADGSALPAARWAAGATGALMLAIAPALPPMAAAQNVVPLAELAPMASALQIVAAVGGLALIAGAARPRWLPLLGGVAVVLFTPVAVQTTATVAKYKRVAALIKPMPALPPQVRVAEWQTYDHSLGFYTRRRIILVDYRGELSFGSTIGDQCDFFLSGLGSIADLARRGPLLLAMNPRNWPKVRNIAGLRIVAANTSNVFLANDPLVRLLKLEPYPDDALAPGPRFMPPRVAGPPVAAELLDTSW